MNKHFWWICKPILEMFDKMNKAIYHKTQTFGLSLIEM